MSSPFGASEDPLLGRSAEIKSLLGAVECMEQGRGSLVFIEGEAGIGKTSLLETVLAEVIPRGHLVLRGAADELESDRPFGAFAQAMAIHPDSDDPDRAGIARLLLTGTAHASATGIGEVRFRLVEAIVSLTERLALAGPVLLALEDLHWADSSTLLTMHHLGRRLTHLPLVVLATLRPAPRSAGLGRVVWDLVGRGGLHLSLGPLDEGAVTTLVERMAQAPPTARLLAATSQAAGNPLYVKELIRALRTDGVLRLTDGRADADIRVMPDSFRLLVQRQLAPLSAHTLHVLRAAAVLGTSFSLTDLATVLGRPPTDLLDAIDESFEAKIIGEQGEDLVFRHELVREAVYLDLPTAVRRALHLQVGRTLAAGGASAVRVAPHLVRGAMAGDETAVEWLWRAAAQVAPRVPGAAVELFKHALRLLPRNDPRRHAITAEMVDALIWSGRYAEAASQAHELLERDDDTRRKNAVRLSVMHAMLMAGRIEDAVSEAEAASRDFSGDPRDRLRLDIGAALTRVFRGDPAGAQTTAEDVLHQARRLGDEQVQEHAHSVICVASLQMGEIPRALTAGRHALELQRPSVGAAHRYGSYIFFGTALIEADQLDEGDRVLRDGQRIAEETGMTWQAIFYHSQLGLQRFISGRWDDALAELETASLVSEENVGVSSVFAEAITAVIQLHRGSLTLAAEHSAKAQRAVAGGHRLGTDVAIWAAALVQDARGDGRSALATLESAWRLNLTLGFRSQNARLSLDLVQLALAAGQRHLAAAVAEETAQIAAMNPTTSLRGCALVCRGLAETDLEVLSASVQAYRESPRVAERAWACLAAGGVFAQAGKRDMAVELLTEGIHGCEGIGAGRDIARAEATLRRLGISRGRRGRRGPRGRPAMGWASLTPTELKVVGLAVEGLTNDQIGKRLFISGRTVESHFTHVFAKLGVTSRVEVVAEAVRHLEGGTTD